jgi:hypothetical protein
VRSPPLTRPPLAAPALSHLIPILGSPDYAALMSARAQAHGLALTAPQWPGSLGALVRMCDAVHMPLDLWSGKRILAIGGARDTLVPVREGGTTAFVDALVGHGLGDRVALKVDEDAGHEVTPKVCIPAGGVLSNGSCSRIDDRLGGRLAVGRGAGDSLGVALFCRLSR